MTLHSGRSAALFALFGVVACSGSASSTVDGGHATGGSQGSGGAMSSGGSSSSGGSGDTTGSGASASTGGHADPGEECSADVPCQGTCTGTGCGTAWTCSPVTACTDDLVEYCGCDGETFTDSGSCPTRPYAHEGACSNEGGLHDCNTEHIVCLPLVAPEPCPAGQAYAVTNGCYGGCVDITQCQCSTAADCPDPDDDDGYACYAADHCGPLLK